MTIGEARAKSGLEPLDAEVLLSAILKKERSWIIAHEHDDIAGADLQTFHEWSDRRRNGEPVAYITGEKEFYGRSFMVDSSVLIPRPATEGLIDATLAFLDEPKDATTEIDSGIVAWTKKLRDDMPTTIVDVGTGSGAIAITLALEKPEMKIVATDIGDEALIVAKRNAERHGVSDRIEWRRGSALGPILDLTEPFLVVSNPPYIPSDRILMKDVMDFEPHVSLFSGENGSDVIDEITARAKEHPYCVGWIIECEAAQADG